MYIYGIFHAPLNMVNIDTYSYVVIVFPHPRLSFTITVL